MKEYLKMADVFDGYVTLSSSHVIAYYSDSNHDLNWDSIMAGYAAHAINSHDELVAEVDRLRGDLHNALAKFHDADLHCQELQGIIDSLR